MAGANAPSSDGPNIYNSTYMGLFQAKWDQFRKLPQFENFFELGCLIISTTFAQGRCDADLAAGKLHEFKGSIGSIDAFSGAHSAVNIEQIAIDDLVSYHFPADGVPEELPFTFLIQAPQRKWKAGSFQTSWKLISPLEEHHAVIEVVLKSKDSLENLRKWRNLCESVDISVKFCLQANVRREAFTYRGGRLATAKATVHTAQQRCQVVLAEPAILQGLLKIGKVPNTKVADLMSGFKTVPGLDTFKPTFVDAAVASDKLLKDTRAMRAFEYFKRQGFTSPMNSAYKTGQLVRKGGDDDGIAFCTELLVDQCKSKHVDTSGIPLEHLSGDIVNCLGFAYDLSVYLLGPWLSSFGLPETI